MLEAVAKQILGFKFGCHTAMSNPRQRNLSLHGYEPTMSQFVYVCTGLGLPPAGIASVAYEKNRPGFTTPDGSPKPSERSFTVLDPWPKHPERRSLQDHRLLSLVSV